jgi:hypothetical protein
VSLHILQGLVADPIKERGGHRRMFIKIQSAICGKLSRDTQKLAGVLQFAKSSIVFYDKGCSSLLERTVGRPLRFCRVSQNESARLSK